MPRGMYGVGVGVGTPYYYEYPGARNEAETRQECWACMIIPITFWIFVSLTLSLGLYGTTHLVLGPNYSHYLEASPIFVKEIKVKDEGRYNQAGPMLYGFSTKPKLGVDRNWSTVHGLLVDPKYHQEIAVWLNKDSKVGLHCEVKNNGFHDVIVVILKGRESLEEWIHSPSNTHLGEVRLKMHGPGQVETEYRANEAADYYFAVGNFNQRTVKVVMTLNFTSKLYDTGRANYECSVRKGLCAVKLFLTGNKYAVLATENNTTDVMNVWYVELSYGARLLTYILILGVVVLVVYCIFKVMGHLDRPVEETEIVEETERAPLLPPKESGSQSSTYGTLEQDQESGLSSSAEDLYDGKICIICYDEPRNCFFIPCGHCATCYTCAQRIELDEGKACPICRQGIVKVKRLFNA
jgi:hypothetical protein